MFVCLFVSALNSTRLHLFINERYTDLEMIGFTFISYINLGIGNN